MMTTQTVTRPASLTERQEQSQLMGPLMAERLARGLTYQPEPSDLFIAPFAKCGTTWVQQIVHGLRTRGDMNFDDLSQVIPFLEIAHYIGLDLAAPQPGGFQAFKSHVSWTKIPKGGRYIVSFRDPKDALVFYYNFVNGYWWQQRHNPNVSLLCYEGMKADLPATVETIAHFLGIELDQDLLNLVLKHASLEFMLAHKSKFADPLYQEVCAKHGFLPPSETLVQVKTGQVGDHRTELPLDIGAEMDTIWRETVEPRTGLSSYQALRAALA
jgi:hypothetical protein